MARMEQAASKGSKAGIAAPKSQIIKPVPFTILLTLIAVGALVNEGSRNKEGSVYKWYESSFLRSLYDRFYEATWGQFKDILYPVSDKLLPDWPTAPCYGNPLPGTPAPPVLVIDLERTLIGSIHDATHGWRHVKRPGADKFLEALANYYEIVLFSEMDKGLMIDVFESLDKQGRCHKFGSAEGEVRDNITLKRLDVMNRDVGRILLLDDSKEASKLFPRNTLLVKPFEDVYDVNDRALLDLIPLLQAFVHEDVQDFRTTIDALGTHDAQEAVHEYELRLAKKKMTEEEKKNKGLGGLIRTQLVTSAFPNTSATKTSSSSADQGDGASAASPAPAAAPTPAPTKKKGLLFQMLDDTERVKEEAEMKKREKMNEIYTQRLREKMAKEAQQKEKRERDRELDH